MSLYFPDSPCSPARCSGAPSTSVSSFPFATQWASQGQILPLIWHWREYSCHVIEEVVALGTLSDRPLTLLRLCTELRRNRIIHRCGEIRNVSRICCCRISHVIKSELRCAQGDLIDKGRVLKKLCRYLSPEITFPDVIKSLPIDFGAQGRLLFLSWCCHQCFTSVQQLYYSCDLGPVTEPFWILTEDGYECHANTAAVRTTGGDVDKQSTCLISEHPQQPSRYMTVHAVCLGSVLNHEL